MDKNEKKIIENLDYMTEDIEIPDSLRPEAVAEMLKEHEVKENKKKIYWRPMYSKAVAAAFALLILGSAAVSAVQPVFGLPQSRISNVVPKRDFTEKLKEGIETIAHPGSYEEVYEYIQAYHKRMESYSRNNFESVNDVREDSAMEFSKEDMADTGYSETNVRTDGVSEGDTVKTDGNYLYILKDTIQITVLDVREAEMKEVNVIPFKKGMQVCEFYLEGDKLIALGTEYEEDGTNQSRTRVITYDISDPENIKEVGTVTQSGNYDSSRITDGFLYVFSNFGVSSGCGVNDFEEYIPEAGGELISKDDILLPLKKEGCSYYVTSSIDLKKPDEIKESKGIFHNGGLTYVSRDNIFLCETDYDKNNEVFTNIRKISYKDGKLIGKATGKVQGRLESSFSIDEYEGYLRMVVTCDNAGSFLRKLDETDIAEEQPVGPDTVQELIKSNSVYVLDQKLKVIGSIENLAEDEKIYSARFMGDTAYFVTYRQIDPLFSVDLSDPENPEIIGSLKIPGFSEYLHPYGDGLLLGIGCDVDETGMTSNGIKLSMFDISDPSNVREIDKYVIENVYASPALEDYKAVLIDAEKNIIGFSGYGEYENYYVFSYDKGKGFEKNMEKEVNNILWTTTKGLYIDNRLYVIGGNVVEVYEMPSYEKVDDIIIS